MSTGIKNGLNAKDIHTLCQSTQGDTYFKQSVEKEMACAHTPRQCRSDRSSTRLRFTHRNRAICTYVDAEEVAYV